MVNTAAVTGDTPGLYGGTRSDTCNAQGIRTYLETNPEKAQAWATAVNLPPAQVGPFLTSLTPVSLRTDTAVTNHGFKEGVATPFQTVLQAGTAVLVDPQGLPRVRCYCGNPLGEPNQQTSARYTGASWEGFSGKSVTVIAKSRAEVREFVVVEPDTKQVVNRPQGTSGEKDRAADPAVAEQVTEDPGSPEPTGSESSSAPSAQFQNRQGGSNPAQLNATNQDEQGPVPANRRGREGHRRGRRGQGGRSRGGHGRRRPERRGTAKEARSRRTWTRPGTRPGTDRDKTGNKTEDKTGVTKKTDGKTGVTSGTEQGDDPVIKSGTESEPRTDPSRRKTRKRRSGPNPAPAPHRRVQRSPPAASEQVVRHKARAPSSQVTGG